MLQAGDPAFGALLLECTILCRQGETHHLYEIGGGFLWCEAQVSSTQFQYGVSPTQMDERQWRVFAGRKDDVHLGRQVVQQKGESVMNRSNCDDLVIIQYEDDVGLVPSSLQQQVIEQQGQYGLYRNGW